MLLAQELVALLGFLVFLDGHQVHRPHLVDALLQRLDLLRHGGPVGGRAGGGHFLRRHHVHLGRAFVGVGDGDALAANVVEVDVVFLLDPLAQVLHGHVLLRQLDIEGAALFLQLGQAPALLAQALPRATATSASCDCFCATSSAVCAFTCSRSCCSFSIWPRDSWISDSACSLRPTKEESSPRRCSITWVSSRMRCSSDCCCCWNEAHICSSVASATLLSVSPALAASRCWRKPSSRAVNSATCAWRALLARFAFAGLGRQRGALLQAFLFLRGQALDLINDRVDLLVQQALGILQRVELAFVRGDGHFLGAQFGLRLLQAGLKFGLLALQRAFARG